VFSALDSSTLRQLNGTRFIARAIVVDKVNSDYNLIIGLPTIQSYNLSKILHTHLRSIDQLCEVCSQSMITKQNNLHIEEYNKNQSNFKKNISNIWNDML
jgi:hypothetical protein